MRDLDVLIVDEDADARDLLAMFVESRGASVRRASSSDEALLAIEARRPNVLLSDLMMPDRDGFALVRAVRAREREQVSERLPAIAVTAHATARDREEASAAGYDALVAKPVDADDLARAIVRMTQVET